MPSPSSFEVDFISWNKSFIFFTLKTGQWTFPYYILVVFTELSGHGRPGLTGRTTRKFELLGRKGSRDSQDFTWH